MSTTGCCRGLSAKDCIARPYGCFDEPAPKNSRAAWHVVNLNTTRHSTSAEFSDKSLRWGVAKEKHPVSLVGVFQVPTRAKATRLCAALNGKNLRRGRQGMEG